MSPNSFARNRGKSKFGNATELYNRRSSRPRASPHIASIFGSSGSIGADALYIQYLRPERLLPEQTIFGAFSRLIFGLFLLRKFRTEYLAWFEGRSRDFPVFLL